MGLGQFLDVGDVGNQRIVIELDRADLEHMQDDLRILGIVLVPAVMQRLAGAGQRDRRDQLQIEASLSEVMRQGAMVVAGCLEPDPHG